MDKVSEARAIITASYILFLIDGLLDASEKNKGSVIALKQALLSKTTTAKSKCYVEISNEGWASMVKYYSKENKRLYIWDAVENLAYSEYENMTKVFGKNIFNLINSFVAKQTPVEYDKKVLAESREVTDRLTFYMKKLIRKIIKKENKC
jgi:hypothetical protein